MRKRIRVITPIVTEGFSRAEDFQPAAGVETELSHARIERGPASIECEFDEALAVPDTVARIIEAERDGVDAVVIDCMGDPGMKPGREAVSIPVLGPGQATMHLAAVLGHRFSVITVIENCIPMMENQARVYGVAEKLASVRAVHIPVLELEQDQQRLTDALVEQSVMAIEDDGAHAIIFGCTGMIGCAQEVQQGLARRGYGGVPVIDPMPATIKLAEALVDLGLSHSKRTYATPPTKRVVGYDALEQEKLAVPA